MPDVAINNSNQGHFTASLRKYNFEQTVQPKQNTLEHVTTCEVNTLTVKPLETTGHESFHGIARVQRNLYKRSQEPKTMSVLMDPGAEINLIRGDFVNTTKKYSAIKIHATMPQNIELTNNGKIIGHVREAVYLSFVLDTLPGVAQQTYHEWFHVFNDLKEQLILGSAFNKQQCFTSYHTRLEPWRENRSPEMQKAYEAKQRNTQQIEQVKQGALRANAIDDEFSSPPDSRELRNPRGQASDVNDVLWDTALNVSSGSTNRKRERERERESVITPCERVDAHAAKHSNGYLLHQSQIEAGKRAKAKRNNAPALQRKSHESHVPFVQSAPVQFNQMQTRQIANMLAKSAIDEQKKLYKSLQKLGQRNAALSMDEAENIRETAKLCAVEAEAVFKRTQQLLDAQVNKTSISEANSRYFMDWEGEGSANAPVAPEPGPATKFVKGQMCILHNLVDDTELNGKPGRIVNYDAERNRYAIATAKPRGYWLVKEANLKALDPPRDRDDYVACGIDQQSGQPTLDPLVKPVHRQYGKEYSAELTAKIKQLLEQYKDVFGKDISIPCKFRPMSIPLVPNPVLPRNPRYWRNSPAQREEVRKQLQSMIDMKVVRASATAIVSNVLLVKRPGMPGKFRFTIDFRDLNNATENVPWQMPDVHSQLERLSGNCIFGCIDLSSYYHQIELDEGSKFLTGFITEDGVFEYNRVAMGLKGACAHAQSCLQTAIDKDPVLSKYGLRNYFDDLPLAAKSVDEFIEQLEAVLKMGRQYNLKFNLEKSIFGVDSITHVGFIVNANGIEVDPQRLESLRDIPVPKSMKGVQSVLGIWNYIRRFIPDFSTRALPLTNLVGTKAKAKLFRWTTECQAAFDDLKAATLNTKLLANINYNEPIYIRCDSSQYGAGAVLFQIGADGHEHPISYASRKYTMAERGYCTFQQEAAAVVWSLEKFSEFHQGHHVIVQSDHKNLSWIKKTAMPQLTRWRLRLQDFDFSLEYYEGSKNVVADGLSRKYVDDEGIDISIRDFIPEHAAASSIFQGTLPQRALNSYKCRQKGGLTCAAQRVWEDAEDTAASEDPEEGSELCEEPSVTTDETCDDWFAPITSADFAQLSQNVGGASAWAPELQSAAQQEPPVRQSDLSEIDKTIGQFHNATVGHDGVYVTLSRVLRANKTWATRKEMMEHIDQFISGCEVCQKFRKRHNRRTGQRFVISGSPFAELSVDILKLPKRDCNGNLYVVVVIDSFSRWVSLTAVPDKCALSAARAIISTVGNFGVPVTIRSDGGREFINDTVATVEHLLGTQHHKITPYLHEGNSLAEKANRSVLENLRNIIFDSRYRLNGEHQWSDLLPLVQRIMNASFNSSIGCSPATLVFGNNLDLDRCLVTPANDAYLDKDVDDYIATLSHNQRVVLEAANEHLSTTHAKNLSKWKTTHKTDLSLHKAMQDAEAGVLDAVWVLARVRDDAPLAKWKPRWAGPFRLLDFKTNSQSIVRLYDTVHNNVVEAHINDVALWNTKFVHSVEGLKKIAETDGWQYPIEGILGIALDPEDDNVEPVALPLDRARAVSNKHKYVFSVKWRGYDEPSWEPYSSLAKTTSLLLFARTYPVLKLVKAGE